MNVTGIVPLYRFSTMLSAANAPKAFVELASTSEGMIPLQKG